MSATGQSIEYEPKWTNYQKYVRDTLEAGTYDLVVFRTGYGGGKTITGCQWVHGGALKDRTGDGESLVMGQDFQKAEATTFKVFFETLPGEHTAPNDANGDPENSPIVAGYNENKKRLTYITGHVARLGSADKWSRYAGGEFQRIYCDEVAHYETTDLYDLHEMLTSRQRTAAGPNTMLWTSTGNGYNQFYDITERQVDANEEPLVWADNMHVVTASTEHNNLLPPDGLEKIKDQFEGTAREEQALHGGFAASEGLVYNDFTRKTHVRPRAAIDVVDDWRIYGYDYGHADPRVLLEIGKTPADQYVVLDCYYKPQQPVEHLVGKWDDGRLVRPGWIQKEEKQPGRVYCDHDPEHIEKFRKAGFQAEKATKDLDEGIDEVRSTLQVDEAIDGPGLLVVDDCVELIQEFQSYKEEHVGKAVATDHALDSLRYAIMGDNYGRTYDDQSWTW